MWNLGSARHPESRKPRLLRIAFPRKRNIRFLWLRSLALFLLVGLPDQPGRTFVRLSLAEASVHRASEHVAFAILFGRVGGANDDQPFEAPCSQLSGQIRAIHRHKCLLSLQVDVLVQKNHVRAPRTWADLLSFEEWGVDFHRRHKPCHVDVGSWAHHGRFFHVCSELRIEHPGVALAYQLGVIDRRKVEVCHRNIWSRRIETSSSR
mmetsp:Transcript_2373/g.5142  ORF Transcript_2373/g.5142 Transcript_2373/m.5142 type:complete len:207 (-) Transcript_2373:1735-2355(-)